ncbi:TetR family transcriptional regulator [Actinomycetospora sp. NBRC 106375]|uniref:SACE_7040 family transcriptional regulator n=1 Tax=Actinomycetospora sp. NBRC 106375 TaxID=3032207 RepID=UPI0024A23003|nr:TetR/AcrR family transcriptional regulator [Actinomycetospora sp. NBRC 106375]GLZ44879.1 TetR family transcriptional regulator [Actinomycetospora sp. NBRC 106375]
MPVTVSRREQILTEAARLFAAHGFHGVSIDGIGAAVGVSGPALYRHFPSKEGLLAEMLVGISEHLLAGGQERAAEHAEPVALLDALIAFHTDFALHQPELITVQDRDLANLPDEARRRVRGLQRAYVEIWVDALQRAGLAAGGEAARVGAHAAFGLMNSTPRSAGHTRPEVAAPVLVAMTRAALHAQHA